MTLRLGILVEGFTEERFIKDLLAPHLFAFQVYAEPVVVTTKRVASGKKHKGGGVNMDRLGSELGRLLPSFAGGYVTTMLDFYGFEDRQPGETVDALEGRIAARMGRPRNLFPYVQRHEFEALLLSDPAVVADYFQAPALENVVRIAVGAAGTPEDVNDKPETAPSKRLEAWTTKHAPVRRRYFDGTKTNHGPALAGRLTLPVIRAACPRFDSWVATMERLTSR